jgi:hypothetical protein
MKYGDERRALVMRVPLHVAHDFTALVQTKARGARSATLAALITAELERHDLNLADRQFDAPPRRGRRETEGAKSWVPEDDRSIDVSCRYWTGPRVTLTFKVSRRVVRGLIWIVEQRGLRANTTVGQLIAEEQVRRHERNSKDR